MTSYDQATALLVVDVQNDFADPGGSLYVRGGEGIIPRINDEIAAALAAHAMVVYTQDWHPPSTPHFEKDGGIWPVHCVWETWGAELHPALLVDGTVLRKGVGGEDGYSAFTVRDPESGSESATLLESMLRTSRIERLVIMGLATDYCVKETALDAAERGFHVTVVRDAIGAVDLRPGDGERAVEAMREAGTDLE
jgi:nicotinamidase/pyrazinamidase